MSWGDFWFLFSLFNNLSCKDLQPTLDWNTLPSQQSQEHKRSVLFEKHVCIKRYFVQEYVRVTAEHFVRLLFYQTYIVVDVTCTENHINQTFKRLQECAVGWCCSNIILSFFLRIIFKKTNPYLLFFCFPPFPLMYRVIFGFNWDIIVNFPAVFDEFQFLVGVVSRHRSASRLFFGFAFCSSAFLLHWLPYRSSTKWQQTVRLYHFPFFPQTKEKRNAAKRIFDFSVLRSAQAGV